MFKFRRKQKLVEDIQILEVELKKRQEEKLALDKEISVLQKEASKAQAHLNSIQKITLAYGTLEEVGYSFTPLGDCLSSLEKQLAAKEEQYGDLISSGLAFVTKRQYLVDGSISKGAKFQDAFAKNTMIGFNQYFQSKAKSVTVENYTKTLELVGKSFNKYNRQGDLLCINMSQQVLTIAKDIIRLKLNIKVAKAEEKEKIRQEKQRLKEQEKLLEEIAKEKEKLAKERRYYEKIYGETNSDAKRLEIQQHLAEIDKREADVEYREQHYRAGWLYVAYTPAMPNCVKIGVTRRLHPLVRLQELSSASVPFPFECKGLVFDDNVFDLEAKVHKYFDDKRVNKANRHKEFFFITPEKAIEVLQKHFYCDVILLEELDKTEEI